MATINLCERCGTMATSQAMGGVQSWDAPQNPMGEAVELCPGCVGDFKRFMSYETVAAPADRPQSYRKPWEEPKSDSLSSVSTEEIAKALLSRQLEAGEYRDQ